MTRLFISVYPEPAKPQSPANSPCNFEATKVIVVNCDTTGIQSIAQNAQHLSIYPNPAQNIANIEWQPVNEQVQLSLSDLLGREIKNFKRDGATGKSQIDISDLANGIYVVKLFTVNGSVVSGRLAVGR